MKRAGRLTPALALGLAATAAAHEPRPARYTVWDDVRPILERHCTSCHSPGGAGPMSLVGYEDIRPWAAGIQREVLERRMPPWAPEDGAVAYRGERLLSAREIDVLIDWITGATPEGDATAAPRSGSTAGADGPSGDGSVLELAVGPVVLGSDELEKAVCRVVEVPSDAPVWLRGIALRPGAKRTLRRAVVSKAARCDAGGAPLLVWVPGQPPLEWPAGAAERLEPGARLALRLEYRKIWDDDGTRVEDASALLLRRAPRPGRPPERRRTDGEPLPDGVRLLALVPEGAVRDRLEVTVESPAGRAELLLELRHPDPLWLGRYELAEPLSLPAGSVLRSRGGGVWAELLPER